MINDSFHNLKSSIKATAFQKSRLQISQASNPALDIVAQKNIEYPVLSYADKKTLEKKILQVYESANSNVYEIFKAKQHEMNLIRFNKVNLQVRNFRQ